MQALLLSRSSRTALGEPHRSLPEGGNKLISGHLNGSYAVLYRRVEWRGRCRYGLALRDVGVVGWQSFAVVLLIAHVNSAVTRTGDGLLHASVARILPVLSAAMLPACRRIRATFQKPF